MSTRKFNTDLELQKNTGLSVPDAGYLLVAPKADDNLYLKTSAGTEKRLLTTDDSSSYVHPTGFNSVPASALTNAAVISQITVNTEGHVTGVSTRQLQPADINAQDEILVRAYSLIGNSTANDDYPIMNVGIGAGLGFDGNGSLYVTAGGGSVTSVGLAMPNIFTVTGSPVTTSGTLTAALATQTQRQVFASPVNATGVPTFRALAAEDLPDLSAQYDNYYCWKVRTFDSVDGTEYQMVSAQRTPSTNQYNGLRLKAGTDIGISSASGGSGYLDVTISYTGSVGGVTNGDKGDITVSGTGNTWTIDSGAVTYAKMQGISAENRILGRANGAAATVAEMTPAQVRTSVTSDLTSDSVTFLNTGGTATKAVYYDYLTSNTAANTSTTQTESLLSINLPTGGVWYKFEAVIAATSGTGTGGNAFGIKFSGSSTNAAIMIAGTTTATAMKSAKLTMNSSVNGFLTTAATTGMIKITGMLLTVSGGNLIVTYAAQGTTSCQLLAGSFLTVTTVG